MYLICGKLFISVTDSWYMTKLTLSSFLYIYFNSLHVSSNPVLIIRRINCVNKIDSPDDDDEHGVARNMQRIEVNI